MSDTPETAHPQAPLASRCFATPLKGAPLVAGGAPATAVARMAGSAALWGCKNWSRTWSFASGPSGAMARVLPLVPSGRAEKRRAGGGHGLRSKTMLRALTRCGCPSGAPFGARSEFRNAAPRPSIAGCPQRSAGTRQVGSPFFCLLFFGEAKKSRCAAGRTSRPATIPKDARAGNQTSVEQGFDKLSPNGRCHSSGRWDSERNQPPALSQQAQTAIKSEVNQAAQPQVSTSTRLLAPRRIDHFVEP